MRAHHIDAGDVRVDSARHIDALHLRTVLRIAENVLGRYDAGLEDVLLVIDVVDERIECAHALLQPCLQDSPLILRNDARDDVERDQPLGVAALAVDGEGDADPMKDGIGLGTLGGQHVSRLSGKPGLVRSAMRARCVVRVQHFIVGDCRTRIGGGRKLGVKHIDVREDPKCSQALR